MRQGQLTGIVAFSGWGWSPSKGYLGNLGRVVMEGEDSIMRRAMNRTTIIVLLAMGVLVMQTETLCAQAERQRVQYEPTWESLDKHQTPEWFMDAKLGIGIMSPMPTKAEFDTYSARPYGYADSSHDKGPWSPDALAEAAVARRQLPVDVGYAALVAVDQCHRAAPRPRPRRRPPPLPSPRLQPRAPLPLHPSPHLRPPQA